MSSEVKRWKKGILCLLFGMMFTNICMADQVSALESSNGNQGTETDFSVKTEHPLSLSDLETETFSSETGETEEKGDTPKEGLILISSDEASGTHSAVSVKADEMLTKAMAMSEKAKAELTVGEELYYGNYSTNYFAVNGKPAYCLEPLKDTPESGEYEAQTLTGGLVRKGLYYAYGGPGYELYRAKYGSIGVGESYSINDEYCMSHCILSYLYMGTEEAFVGLDGQVIEKLKQKAKNMETMPDPPESFYAFLFNINAVGQTMGGSGKDRVGSVEIYKHSDYPEWIEGNSCYSLAGAVFGIYEKGKEKVLWELTTDELGYAKKENIPIGNYEIRELKAPAGLAIDFESHPIRINENEVCTYKCTDKAQYYPVDLILRKTDKETGTSQAQGAASLEGAEFAVKYYYGYHKDNPTDAGQSSVREWIMKTDSKGMIKMDEAHKVSGDPFYKTKEGQVVLPLGTVSFQEIKAPKGYLLNSEVITEIIQPKAS